MPRGWFLCCGVRSTVDVRQIRKRYVISIDDTDLHSHAFVTSVEYLSPKCGGIRLYVAAAALTADQVQKRQIKGIRSGPGIECETHGRVHIDVNLVERDLPCVERIDAVSDGILCRQFNVAAISLAGPFEQIDGKIASYFCDAAAVPVPELSVFIEEGDGTPFTLSGQKLGTLDGFGQLKNSLKIAVTELAEDAAQLGEELRSEFAIFRRRNLTFALGREARGDKQHAQENNAYAPAGPPF